MTTKAISIPIRFLLVCGLLCAGVIALGRPAQATAPLNDSVPISNSYAPDDDNWDVPETGPNAAVRAAATRSYTFFTSQFYEGYLGGDFTSADGNTNINYVGRLAGSEETGFSWQSLAQGVSGPVYALAVDNAGDLYVGGDFSGSICSEVNFLGGCQSTVVVNNIAKWDTGTSSWSSVNQGVNGPVHALAINSNNDVIVGGEFTQACLIASCGSTIPANHIISYASNGALSITYSGGVNNTVLALATDSNDNIYAGGSFTQAGGNVARSVAMWNGSWQPLGDGLVNGAVTALAVDNDDNLYAGGHDDICQNSSCSSQSPSTFSQWSGSNWTNLVDGLVVSAITVDTSNAVYAARSGGLYRWDGSSTDSIFGPSMLALAAGEGGRLYGGGAFTSYGGETAAYTGLFTAGVGRCGLSTPGSYTMVGAPFRLNIEVDTAGTLECLSIQKYDSSYTLPFNENNFDTGYRWRLKATDSSGNDATGYTVNLTLPTRFAPQATDRICRNTNDCGLDDVGVLGISSITRDNLTDLFTESNLWTVAEGVIDNGTNALPTYVNGWGTTGSGNGQFNTPGRMDASINGDLFVIDKDNNRVQVFNPDGTYLYQWGSFGTAAGEFRDPGGIAVSRAAGTSNDINVFVADTTNHRVQRFSNIGTYETMVTGFGSGVGLFNNPVDVAVDTSGYVYVADAGNERIQKFDTDLNYLLEWSLPFGSNLVALDVDRAGRVIAADDGTQKIYIFDNTKGTQLDVIDYSTTANVLDLAVDSTGEIHVVMQFLSNAYGLQVYAPDGNRILSQSNSGTAEGEFDQPAGIAIDRAGNNRFASGDLWIADSGGDRVQQFRRYVVKQCNITSADSSHDYTAGQVKFSIGSKGESVFSKFAALSGEEGLRTFTDVTFQNRFFLTLNPADNGFDVYMWHEESGPMQYTINGIADLDSLEYVLDAAVDAEGNIVFVVADNGSGSSKYFVRRFTRAGMSDGSWTEPGGLAGSSSGAFDNPTALTVDPAGNVYVADSDNNRIQKFDNTGAYVTEWTVNGIVDLALAPGNRILALDGDNDTIELYSDVGTFLGSEPVDSNATRVHVDDESRVYVLSNPFSGTSSIEEFNLFSNNFNSLGSFFVGSTSDVAATADNYLYTVDETTNATQWSSDTCLRTSWKRHTHPQAGAVQDTGQYWHIHQTGTATFNLTLPHNGLVNGDGSDADVCFKTNTAAWDCAQSSATAETVTRTIPEPLGHKQWAVGGDSCTVPVLPTNSGASNWTGTAVALDWDADANPSYEVWRGGAAYLTPFGLDDAFLLATPSTDAYTDSAVNATANYFYQVRGVNACGGQSDDAPAIGKFSFGITPGD